MAPGIQLFVSYRRDDTAGYAGRLYDDLAVAFGPQRIFFDVSTIELGQDFGVAIKDAIDRSTAVLALIGPTWLATTAAGTRRLDDPNDFVRLEIAAAIEAGKLLIPVLLAGAGMPSEASLPAPIAPLRRRQSFAITHARWRADVDLLIDELVRLHGQRPQAERNARADASDHNVAAPVSTGSRRSRRLGTILSIALSVKDDDGRLDPEAREVLSERGASVIGPTVSRHGGSVIEVTVESVRAGFGIRDLHEDDALRAVRAATDIVHELSELAAGPRPTIRIRPAMGIQTGEVLVTETRVSGEALAAASRLAEAAEPGEILIGVPTYRLVRDAVIVEAIEPISARGKAERVPAYRLVSVAAAGEGHVRRFDRPIVGREAELARLRATFAEAVTERSPRLVTVLGIAGVGKSRLVTELLAGITAETTVLKGRCLPYGEGITYWPIREIVHGAAGVGEGDSRDDARAKVRALLDGAPDADIVAARVGVALGLETEGAPQEEIFWAIRKLFEHLARDGPLVTVWEDIHWAEPTLLDLIEYILDLATDAPLLLVCPARPELVEARPGWGGARASSTVMHLEPLAGAATETLIDSLPGGGALPDTLRTRILAAAEGNPLYLEEMLAMLVDEGYLVKGDEAWHTTGDLEELEVPQSIRALLAARIEGLPDAERRVAERASVVGRVFEAAAVRELTEDSEGEIGPSLLALVRKELVRPERSELSAGDAFKFRHLMIRDAAYESLPKADRAELHERFAGWLERAAGERRAEYDEILGYHLEQAHRYRTELGESGERVDALAIRGGEQLFKAGTAALQRDEWRAAISIFERADGLLGPRHRKAAVLALRLAQGHARLGGRASQGRLDLLGEAERRARSPEVNDPVSLEIAGLEQLLAAFNRDPNVDVGRSLDRARESLLRLEALDDVNAIGEALHTVSFFEGIAGHEVAALEAALRALELAEIGDSQQARLMACVDLANTLPDGPVPTSEGIARLSEIREKIGGTSLWAEGVVLGALAQLHGYAGRFAEARILVGEMRRLADDLRSPEQAAGARAIEAFVDLLAGRAAAASEAFADVYRRAGELRFMYMKGGAASDLACALVEEGRLEEALAYAAEAEQLASPGDATTQVAWRTARARAAAGRGDCVLAETIAREAVELALGTERPVSQGDALLALATVQSACGDVPGARNSAQLALARYDAKEAGAGSLKAREMLSSLDKRLENA